MTSTFGKFVYSVEAEIPHGLEQALVNYGLTQLVQRVPASNAEYALAESLGITDGWEQGKKAGSKAKRPKGFERGSMPYTPDNAEVLREGFGTEVEVSDGVKLKFVVTSVTENTGAGEDPMVGARRFVENLVDMDGGLEKLIGLLNLMGHEVNEDTDTEEFVKLAHASGWGQRKGK